VIQVRPPICPYCRQPMKLFRTISRAAPPGLGGIELQCNRIGLRSAVSMTLCLSRISSCAR
jgi:hypothetical protein